MSLIWCINTLDMTAIYNSNRSGGMADKRPTPGVTAPSTDVRSGSLPNKGEVAVVTPSQGDVVRTKIISQNGKLLVVEYIKSGGG